MRTITNAFIAIIMITAAFFSGCVLVNFTDIDAVAGKGSPEKYEITVSPYNKIKTNGNCEVRYFAGSFAASA
jgi:hypothetical protein